MTEQSRRLPGWGSDGRAARARLGLGSAKVAPGTSNEGRSSSVLPGGLRGMPGSLGAMPAAFPGRFRAGLVPPAVPQLSPPRSPRSPAGTKPDSSPKGPRGLGIRAEFLKQTGTSTPRSPRQDAAVTKGTWDTPGQQNVGALCPPGAAVVLIPVGILFPFIPSDPVGFSPPPQMKAAPKKPRGASTS